MGELRAVVVSELDGYTPEQIEEARQAVLKRREQKRRYRKEHAVEIAEKRRMEHYLHKRRN